MLSETTDSPTSPVHEDSDALLSPREEEPQPGINGNTVRCEHSQMRGESPTVLILHFRVRRE